MKKLNILLLSGLSLVMTVVSCSKDDKEVTVTPVSKIPIGKFVFDKWTDTANGVVSEERLAYKPECTDRRYLEFKPEGELEERMVGTVDEPCTLVYYQGSYTQVGDVLTLVEDTYIQTFTVLDVTPTKLKIRRTYTAKDVTHLITYTLVKE